MFELGERVELKCVCVCVCLAISLFLKKKKKFDTHIWHAELCLCDLIWQNCLYEVWIEFNVKCAICFGKWFGWICFTQLVRLQYFFSTFEYLKILVYYLQIEPFSLSFVCVCLFQKKKRKRKKRMGNCYTLLRRVCCV